MTPAADNQPPGPSLHSSPLVQDGAALAICIARVMFLVVKINPSATFRTVFKRMFKESDSLNSVRLSKCRLGGEGEASPKLCN